MTQNTALMMKILWVIHQEKLATIQYWFRDEYWLFHVNSLFSRFELEYLMFIPMELRISYTNMVWICISKLMSILTKEPIQFTIILWVTSITMTKFFLVGCGKLGILHRCVVAVQNTLMSTRMLLFIWSLGPLWVWKWLWCISLMFCKAKEEWEFFGARIGSQSHHDIFMYILVTAKGKLSPNPWKYEHLTSYANAL